MKVTLLGQAAVLIFGLALGLALANAGGAASGQSGEEVVTWGDIDCKDGVQRR